LNSTEFVDRRFKTTAAEAAGMERERPVKLIGVSKSFGGLRAVDGISLAFSRGKVTSLVGPNGAGKTTLFNLINGFLHPDEGEIWYGGIRIDGLPTWRVSSLGVGRLFQDVRVFRKLTALENVLVAAQSQLGENPLALLFSPRAVRRKEQENLDSAKHWLEWVDLSDKANTLAEDLSYGQQKLLAIARLLVGGYAALLLDEPTAGVNPGTARRILRAVRRLAEEGRTVVVIEHNMTVVLDISDWVFFIDEGRVSAFGRPRDVLGDPEVRAAYLGL